MKVRPQDVLINLLISHQITPNQFKVLYEPFSSNYKDEEYIVSESGEEFPLYNNFGYEEPNSGNCD